MQHCTLSQTNTIIYVLSGMTSLKIGASYIGVKEMIQALRRLFEPKANNNDMVRFIRTEFANDTKHLKDEDCMAFYEYYLNRKRGN